MSNKYPRNFVNVFIFYFLMASIAINTLISCPCCGFLTLPAESYGSYEICSLCNWEDDQVQLSNPCEEGGQNINFNYFGYPFLLFTTRYIIQDSGHSCHIVHILLTIIFIRNLFKKFILFQILNIFLNHNFQVCINLC